MMGLFAVWHDPEKWAPVFGPDHAHISRMLRAPIPLKNRVGILHGLPVKSGQGD